MKIAIISDGVYPYNKGGKEMRWFEIATRLANKGHDIHFYTMKWWSGSDVKKEFGYTLHAISPLYRFYTLKRNRSISQALNFSMHIFPKLIKEEFDILEVDQIPYFPIFPAWLVSRLKNKPMIVTWHEYWGTYWFKYLGVRGIFGYIVEKLANLFSPRCVAVSRMTKDRLWGRNKVLLPNGIDKKHFKGIKPSKEKYDIAYDGRLISHKNVDLLVKVANKNGWKTIIMGSGPEKDALKKLAKNNISFTGFIEDHDKIIANIKSSKVYVSLSEREGFGITVLQALACGVPVVTSNCKDNASKALIIKGVNGYACKPEVGAVESAIKKCLKNNNQMRKSADSISVDYDWDTIAEKAEEIYKNER